MSNQKTLTVDEALNYLTTFKGYPFSRTEYEIYKCTTRQNLKQEDLALFDEKEKQLPVRSGRFNDYSGD